MNRTTKDGKTNSWEPNIPTPTSPAFNPPRHTTREIAPNTSRTRSAITSQAQHPNDPVGDDLAAILDGMDDGKEYKIIDGSQDNRIAPTWRCQIIRFYFQNVNGLRVCDGGIDMLDAMYHMETIRADVFGFAETKLDCRNSKEKSLIQRNKNKVWSHCRISTGSSDLPWHALTKPGGVMLGITGPLVGRLRKTVDDALGRWTGMELLGRDGRKLVIICAYQVSQRGGRPGDFTAYSQQVSILRRRGHHNTNP